MVKAKVGFEDLFDNVVAKQANLKAEKDAAISKAIAVIDAEFAEKEKALAALFEHVAIVTVDEPIAVEETVAEAEVVAEESVASEVEAPVVANTGNVTIVG